jgi:chromosome segregation protein
MSIVLDDPVQHVDDFRTVQLVLSQLCLAGRQIVCAVEDGAWPTYSRDVLPISKVGAGKRLTLGTGEDGSRY